VKRQTEGTSGGPSPLPGCHLRWLAPYVLTVDAAAVGLILATLSGLPPNVLPALALFIVLAALTEFWVIPVSAHGEVTLSITVEYAAAVLFGPAFGALVGGTASLANDCLRRRGAARAAFNAGQIALVGGLSGLTYLALRADDSHSLTTNVLAYVVAAAVYYVANATLSSVVIALHGRRFGRVFWHALREGGVFYFAMAPIGAIAAFCYAQSPWTLLYFPVLLWVVYKGFGLYAKLRSETAHALRALADALERRDPYTYQHSIRVAAYAESLARRLGLPAEHVELIVSAARVHDLGKISIDNRILFKEGRLTEEERRQVNKHSAAGAELAGQFSMYASGAEMIRHHHERWDGAGYPDGLAGQRIPFGSRIIAVADVYDAMTSDRPYRDALPREVALNELTRGRGSQFDPVVVDAFLELDAAASAASACPDDASSPSLLQPELEQT
jgi:putative nucleotidyltransferase with HDIG domain